MISFLSLLCFCLSGRGWDWLATTPVRSIRDRLGPHKRCSRYSHDRFQVFHELGEAFFVMKLWNSILRNEIMRDPIRCATCQVVICNPVFWVLLFLSLQNTWRVFGLDGVVYLRMSPVAVSPGKHEDFKEELNPSATYGCVPSCFNFQLVEENRCTHRLNEKKTESTYYSCYTQ